MGRLYIMATMIRAGSDSAASWRDRRAAATQPDGHRAPAAAVWAALVSVWAFWGGTYLAIRVVVRTMPPFLSASLRFLVAGAVLYAVAVRRGDRAGDRPSRAQWMAAAIIGGSLLLGGNGLVMWAEQTVASGIAALIIASVPLWLALLDRVVLGNRLSWLAVVGLAVGFSGLVLLVNPSGGSRLNLAGAGALMIASLSWAAGSLYARHAPLPKRPLVGTGMQMLAGGMLLGLVGLARGELGQFDPAAVSIESVLGLAYLIVFGSLVAFSAYIWLLRVTRTTLVSTYAYVNPIVAVFLGWGVLSEPISLQTLIAGMIIVVAVALIVSARRTKEPAPALEQR
jgi:drug/metabolite transporter (DMT)-like permease